MRFDAQTFLTPSKSRKAHIMSNDTSDSSHPTSEKEVLVVRLNLDDPDALSVKEEPTRGYRLRYDYARQFYDDGDLERAIQEAEASLELLRLPDFYRIKNTLLVARALDNYEDAYEAWSYADYLYDESVRKATEAKNTAYLGLLTGLGSELEELLLDLRKFQKQDSEDELEESESDYGMEWTKRDGRSLENISLSPGRRVPNERGPPGW
ncbi:hypothetical protein M011DRAFT_269238 [Sporormia fimetaria CBS 119925]|uniref:TPR-like protein n=1 Tax=Sporormia fimetaria CBS 119925 TaxID=1340428 RepID=A0A6A6UYB9_9PLEO|nr:hypothetical protein M011DRAFT_269238 [Sporormia fimetaria CBS 119925]